MERHHRQASADTVVSSNDASSSGSFTSELGDGKRERSSRNSLPQLLNPHSFESIQVAVSTYYEKSSSATTPEQQRYLLRNSTPSIEPHHRTFDNACFDHASSHSPLDSPMQAALAGQARGVDNHAA